MKNAAIILYNETKMSKLAAYFNVPKIFHQLKLTIDNEDYCIFFIELLMPEGEIPTQRKLKFLKKMLGENKIEVVLEKSSAEKTEQKKQLNGEFESCDALTAQISAIKELAVLIKMSQIKEQNLLRTSIGFLTQNMNATSLDLLSDEAVSVMLYESETITEQKKSDIFIDLMLDKGIPAIFSKSIDKIISSSQILLVDESIDLTPYKNKIAGKILIGKNSMEGTFIQLDRVLLWHEPLENILEENYAARFNNEILALIYHFYEKEKPIEYLRKFSYIYSMDKYGNNILFEA